MSLLNDLGLMFVPPLLLPRNPSRPANSEAPASEAGPVQHFTGHTYPQTRHSLGLSFLLRSKIERKDYRQDVLATQILRWVSLPSVYRCLKSDCNDLRGNFKMNGNIKLIQEIINAINAADFDGSTGQSTLA